MSVNVDGRVGGGWREDSGTRVTVEMEGSVHLLIFS